MGSGWSKNQEIQELYEMVIDKKDKLAEFQIVFDRFPNAEMWHMNDLSGKRRSVVVFWRKGRFYQVGKLDVIHGVGVEGVVERHPKVHRALVGGDAHDSPFGLVE